MATFPGHGSTWGAEPPTSVRINWGHPIAQGLSFCVPLTEGAGRAKELVFEKLSDNVPTWTTSEWGVGINAQTGGINWATSIPGAQIPAMPATVFVLMSRVVNPQLGQTIRSWVQPEPTSGYPRVGVEVPSIANVTKLGWIKGLVGSIGGGPSFPTNRPFWAAWLFVGTDSTIYCNGTSVAITDANAYSTAGSNTAHQRIAVLSGGTETGVVNAVYTWRRALSPAELNQLAIDPYCFLVPG